MWLGELVLSGSSTATTHRPIFSNRVTDFCQQTSRTNDARTLDRFLQGIEYQHSNHSIPLPSSLIFNQPSLLITFFHTFTITFAFFTPFRKFNTFSLFFSALQRIRTCLSLLSTSDGHGSPAGKFLPTRTRTRRNSYPLYGCGIPVLTGMGLKGIKTHMAHKSS